ncbi:unnamed protein product, partial [Phaeothamnion confervicola]
LHRPRHCRHRRRLRLRRCHHFRRHRRRRHRGFRLRSDANLASTVQVGVLKDFFGAMRNAVGRDADHLRAGQAVGATAHVLCPQLFDLPPHAGLDRSGEGLLREGAESG